MRQAPPGLIAYLQSRQPVRSAELFQFSLINGGTINLTTADVNESASGVTYLSGQGNPLIDHSEWEIKNTPEVPKMTVDIFSNGTDYNGENLKSLAHQGLFDTVHVVLSRGYWTAASNSFLGSVILFSGRAGEVTITADTIGLTFKGDNVRLEQDFPVNTYSTNCRHTLYDVGCKAVRADFTFAATVASSNAITVQWASEPGGMDPDFLAQGVIIFTSGALSGLRRTIGSATGSGVQITYPLFTQPAPGDTFTVCYGCSKTKANCLAPFNNLANFLGFPHVPPAELGF